MRKTLIDYIKKNLKKGYKIDTLRIALINQGYPRASVDVAINEARKEIEKESPELKKEKPKIKYELYDADNKLVLSRGKKSFWKRIFGKE